jgi:3-deoxy-D-manno-octulosonic-acid transferase
MGDARFDQVWLRASAADRDSPLLRLFAGFAGATLVAGSTWPADERHLLPAVARVRAEGTALRLVLVPHEPTPEHLTASEAALDALGMAHVRLSDVTAGGAAELPVVVVVDGVGMLGELYALADAAYVGGGFGTAGLHSVLEPAAFGAPVLFGPRHANAREAAELVAAGGAFEVDDGADLAQALRRLLEDAALREEAGRAARGYVEAGLGAAERGAALVEALLAK